MIELPDWAVPNASTPAFIDAGGVMRSPINTAALKVNRPGSHYRWSTSFPPLSPERGRVIVSRLIRAQREGLRLPFRLAEPQPPAGAPVVDGVGQSGLNLAVRGLTPGLVIREGYWLSVPSFAGQHFLHNVAADVTVPANGRVIIPLSEMLREPFLNSTPVFLERPMIEGLVEGSERAWSLSLEHLTSIEFTIEEAR
ncbi:hypothetical protein NPJ82_09285 [Sphingomonas sp. NY01]|uniref:hypothetical protein n=1 Tax=Sphingomonas sp. NY01 TaxID=2968057 RepID=UPI00315DE17D